MRVKFKGKTLEVKNELNSKKQFKTMWNGYLIEVEPYETDYYFDNQKQKQKLKYEAYCVNSLGSCICDTVVCETISQGVQECFDNIEIDINDLKSQYDEIGEFLELLKDYL